MDVTAFENKRWQDFTQKLEFRHTAALTLVSDGPVLDVGCGDGLFLSLLAEKGIPAEGIDLSDDAVRRCRERGLHAQTYDPAGLLPYPDGSFKTVSLLDVLEHVYDPSTLLREAARVASHSVVISVPNFSSLPARIQVLMGKVPENNHPNKGHVYWFNHPVLRFLTLSLGLQEAGMHMNTFKPFVLFPEASTRAFPNILALSYVGRYEYKR